MNKNMDNILNECLERVVFHGESTEKVLKSYPAYAAELEPLLKTALFVKKAAAISPRADFKARARYEFHQALAQRKSGKHGFFTNLMPRWATALSVALAVLLVSSGTVAAASNSMPDSPLYPVKLATEQAQMTMTFSDEGKAELYAELTDKRVDEIVYMANKGDGAGVTALSHRLDERMDKLAAMAQAAGGGRGSAMMAGVPQPAPQAAEAAPKGAASTTRPPMLGGGAEKGLTGTTPSPAPPPQPQMGITAAEKPQAAGGTADTAATAKVTKEQKLKTMLAAYAIKHPAQLRAALERVPEPIKQDILRSIAVTAAGYEKALRSLEQP